MSPRQASNQSASSSGWPVKRVFDHQENRALHATEAWQTIIDNGTCPGLDPWWSAHGRSRNWQLCLAAEAGVCPSCCTTTRRLWWGKRTASQVGSHKAPKVWMPLVPEDASAAAAAPSLVVGVPPVSLWAGGEENQVLHHSALPCRSFYQQAWKNSSGTKGCGTHAETKRHCQTWATPRKIDRAKGEREATGKRTKSECNRKEATEQLLWTKNYPNCQLERASCKHSATLERHGLFRNNSLTKKSCQAITPGCCIR